LEPGLESLTMAGDLSLNISKLYVPCMPELVKMTRADSSLVKNLPYESDADMTDEEITEGLMEITALSLSDIDEPTYE
jgi:hypothetical protein